MFDFYNGFFFGVPGGCSAKTLARKGKLTKSWAGLNIFYMLINLWRGRVKYDLGDTGDPRFLQLCQIYTGKAGVINYKGEVINLDPQAGNSWSRYGYLNNVTLVDYMGKSYGQYIPDMPGNVMPDCVMIYNNDYDVPPISRIRWYADRLTSIQGSISSCITNMRAAMIISCTKEQEKAIKKMLTDMEEGAPIFFSFDAMEGGYQLRPEILTNPVTGELLKSLMEAYDKTMAEFMTEFGINANGIINKLSGVSDIELKQNEQRTQIAFNQYFEAQKDGIDRVNKMFGTNWSVEPNFTAFTDLSKDVRIEEKEVVDDERTE